MPKLSISEVVTRYGISDKTVRNWIKAGALHPTKIIVAGRFQYVIDSSELESVIAEHNTGSIQKLPVATSNDARIADLEQRVQALEYLISDLRAAKEEKTDFQQIRPKPATRIKQIEIPEGAQLIKEYAELHGLDVSHVKKVTAPGVEYIDKAGMQTLYQKWKDYPARFKACPSCPHE